MNVSVELQELKEAASAAARKSAELEREAIAFYNSIPKWARSTAMRDFLRRLAEHLGWTNLMGVL